MIIKSGGKKWKVKSCYNERLTLVSCFISLEVISSTICPLLHWQWMFFSQSWSLGCEWRIFIKKATVYMSLCLTFSSKFFCFGSTVYCQVWQVNYLKCIWNGIFNNNFIVLLERQNKRHLPFVNSFVWIQSYDGLKFSKSNEKLARNRAKINKNWLNFMTSQCLHQNISIFI